ncbi:unnamed protein product [Symbiodinium sp. CCMP2592]|nr:unnamed protein product [Symbiodinium sp. CCMP2592]
MASAQVAHSIDIPAVWKGLEWACPTNENFAGHRECFHNAGNDRNLILASIGAGTSNWHFNAGGRFDDGHQRHICACGAARPSRPHLVWACPHFRGLRADVQLPENTAQERLFAMEVGCYPEHLVDLLGTYAADRDLYLATDGSSKDGVGSSGVAIQHPDTVGDFLPPGGVCIATIEKDQTPYRMEVQAIALALEAVIAVIQASSPGSLVQRRRLVLVVDCQAAIRAIQSNNGFDYALLLDTIRGYLKKLRDGQLEVMFIWTPSHDKKLGWTPPLGLSAARLRALNEAADKAAAASMGQRIGKAYHDYLQTLGTRPGWHFIRPMRAPKVRWRRVYLVVDCQAAIRAIQGEQGFDYALLLDTIRRYIKKFRDGKLEVEFVWTPSHGKQPTWAPHGGLCATQLRALNEAADKAAQASMERRWPTEDFGTTYILFCLFGVSSSDLFVATDGSSKDGVGSSGIAVQHPDSVAAFGDGLEDQSPYRYVVVDCQAAIRAIQGEQGFDYALLLDTIRRYIKKFRDGKLEVEFVWTPSHGKQPTWAPHGGLCATQLRALNEAADKAAQASMERRWTGSHRRAYAQRARHAQQWETQALKAIATIAKAYRDYLHTLGTPSGEP